ncbi:S1C family serine protease [Undibacterium sp. Ji67W]|uniref:S1C family serine protease n=1 Tax=Undibacterium sp. Ji67W TaxID=3413042 RepID=UPI003BEFF921
MLRLTVLSSLFSLVFCSIAFASDVPPPAVEIQTVSPLADGEVLSKLLVDKIKVQVLDGDDIGNASFGAFCINKQPQKATKLWINSYPNAIKTQAIQELKRLKYPIAGLNDKNAFDTDTSSAPDFRIGAIVKEFKVEMCLSGNLAEGWISTKIEWALYSEKLQKVVFQKNTQGIASSSSKVAWLLPKAITTSFDNFLASPEFLTAIKNSAVVESPVSLSVGGVASNESGKADSLKLAGASALKGGAQKNQAALRNAVVTLTTAKGTGSAFYIDQSGYLLTDYHVVEGSKYANVRFSNGDKLVAEVVRFDQRKDVALLKTLDIDVNPLAIRKNTIEVGEDVFAIGSPMGVLESTMTRGMLSADRVKDGIHLLQSDAAVTFGSSGGPLLDKDGQVIGITVSGMAGGRGFNFFTPISDALAALRVEMK